MNKDNNTFEPDSYVTDPREFVLLEESSDSIDISSPALWPYIFQFNTIDFGSEDDGPGLVFDVTWAVYIYDSDRVVPQEGLFSFIDLKNRGEAVNYVKSIKYALDERQLCGPDSLNELFKSIGFTEQLDKDSEWYIRCNQEEVDDQDYEYIDSYLAGELCQQDN